MVVVAGGPVDDVVGRGWMGGRRRSSEANWKIKIIVGIFGVSWIVDLVGPFSRALCIYTFLSHLSCFDFIRCGPMLSHRGGTEICEYFNLVEPCGI